MLEMFLQCILLAAFQDTRAPVILTLIILGAQRTLHAEFKEGGLNESMHDQHAPMSMSICRHHICHHRF